MEENRKVIAVVVTYNRKELLKEAIEALLNQDYNNCEILVVDNASTDGTREYIDELLKEKQNIKLGYLAVFDARKEDMPDTGTGVSENDVPEEMRKHFHLHHQTDKYEYRKGKTLRGSGDNLW